MAFDVGVIDKVDTTVWYTYIHTSGDSPAGIGMLVSEVEGDRVGTVGTTGGACNVGGAASVSCCFLNACD